MRRLFTPRWILLHTGVLFLTALMVFLGFWQLDRLEQKRERNAAIEANFGRAIETATQDMGTKENEWRRVELRGRYVTEHEIKIINRSQDGVAGDNIAVPFETEMHGTFLVNRGFVPLAREAAYTPVDTMSLVGYVRLTQTRGPLGAVDSGDFAVREFQRFDLPRIRASMGIEMNTQFFVQLIKESPSPNPVFPVPVPLPDLDEGSHFSYALQWFFFSSVAFAAWVVVIRRRLTEPVSAGSPGQTSV